MARSVLFRHCLRLLRQSAQLSESSASSPSLPSSQVPQWTRRRFVKVAGGTAIATRILSPQIPVLGQTPPTIAIVGAGLAGLNAAYQLKKAGLAATVYEARSRLGGRTYSTTGSLGPGLVLDMGGHFINSTHEDMLALANEFDLPLFNRDADASQLPIPVASYYFDGKPRSESEIAASMINIAQQIGVDAALLDEDYEQYAPALDQLSVTAYLDLHANKMSDAFVRTLLEQSIRSEYGVEPEESSALQLLFNLSSVEGDTVEMLASDETYVMEGGIYRLVESLATALSGQIKTRQKLTRIAPQGSGFRLDFNSGEQISADYVIVAIPFTLLRQVDVQVELPALLTRFINEVSLGANEKLFAGFQPKVWRKENGFTKDSWSDQRYSVAWEATQRQSDLDMGALTFFTGGNDAIALHQAPTSFQGRSFLNYAEGAITGIEAAATGKFLRTNWTNDPFTQGAYTNFKPGQLTEFSDFFYVESEDLEERQDVRVANLVFAGEHVSDEHYGFMNGGAQTGRLAADAIIRSLNG